MASISDISAALGDYMLKGWVLTDQTCPTPGCNVPLMRSPARSSPAVNFCVNCDGKVPEKQQSTPHPVASPGSRRSSSNAPPSEVLASPSSSLYELPPESEATRLRREQSDKASSLIGKRLLQGWAMLGEECPNNCCYGVPLVRPPNVGNEKDPKKECVICGNSYLTERDDTGQEVLISLNPTNSPPVSQGAPRYSNQNPKSAFPQTMTYNQTVDIPSGSSTLKTLLPPISAVLDDSCQALQASLQALISRLNHLSSPAMDPTSVGATAEAITRVTTALAQVRQLQWSESQAAGSI